VEQRAYITSLLTLSSGQLFRRLATCASSDVPSCGLRWQSEAATVFEFVQLVKFVSIVTRIARIITNSNFEIISGFGIANFEFLESQFCNAIFRVFHVVNTRLV
jgi:hypothetical protein